MAQTIAIPKLNARVGSYQLPQIEFERNPYAPIADAAERIGGAIEARDAALEKRNLLDAQAAANEQEAALQNFVANRISTAKAENSIGPGFLAAVSGDFDARLKEALDKAPSPVARAEIERRAAGVRMKMMPLLLMAEGGAREAGRQVDVGLTLDDLATAAGLDPMQYPTYRDEAKWVVDGLPEEERFRFDARRQKISESYYRGLIAQNPKLALETLRSREGFAEEDLGIAEPLRKSLEQEADLALEEETRAAEAERSARETYVVADVQVRLGDVVAGALPPAHLYAPLAAAPDLGTKTWRQLETESDAAYAQVEKRAKAGVAAGQNLVARKTWEADDEAATRGLDDHYEAVIADDDGARPEKEKYARKVRFAELAGRTPDALSKDITGAVRSKEPQRRAAAGHALRDLREADGGSGRLTRGLGSDVLDFSLKFSALTDVGFDDAGALKRIDAVEKLTPDQRAARGDYFGRHADMTALVAAVGKAHRVGIAGFEHGAGGGAEETLNDLVYRPGAQSEQSRTLEYDPKRDGGRKRHELRGDGSPQRVDRPRMRILPPWREGHVCKNGECFRASNSLEIDDKIPPEIQRVESAAIARKYGPGTGIVTLKNRASFHQYYNETRIRAPGASLSNVIRLTQIWAAPAPSYDDPEKTAPVKTGDTSIVWTWTRLDDFPFYGNPAPLPGGRVSHYVDRATGAVVNIADTLHLLEPGYIIRWVEDKKDGTFIIHTLGRGTGYAGDLNETLGPRLFNDMDNAIAAKLGAQVLDY